MMNVKERQGLPFIILLLAMKEGRIQRLAICQNIGSCYAILVTGMRTAIRISHFKLIKGLKLKKYYMMVFLLQNHSRFIWLKNHFCRSANVVQSSVETSIIQKGQFNVSNNHKP